MIILHYHSPQQPIILKVRACKRCYLSLREVEQTDEAIHLIGVVVITVFWHLSLLEQREQTIEYMLELKNAKRKK